MIVFATTLAAYVMDDPETWGSWLLHAEETAKSHDEGVIFFAALEVDARGTEPFRPLLDRMEQLPSEWWRFTFDDGREEVTTSNRLRHICMGANLCIEYALHVGASHLMFVGADTEPPPDVLPKLLEMDHSLVGMEIPTYALSGPEPMRDGTTLDFPKRPFFPDFPVQEHMASTSGILIRRDLMRFLRFRSDGDAGMSDDPCLHHDALTLHGVPTYVRKDCIATHHPQSIPSIEYRGHDRTVHR